MSGRTGLIFVMDDDQIWLQWRAGQLSGRTRRRRIFQPVHVIASMEGRAIVRPNSTLSVTCGWCRARFNGGPGNCPAEPCRRFRSRRRRSGFNGGPGNCPAERRSSRRLSAQSPCFNGGPGNCPAELRRGRPGRPQRERFNGGPGNCPAEPQQRQNERLRLVLASMEGRAIVRPNRPAEGRLNQQITASMEGRAIVRPNQLYLLWVRGVRLASMEGRAIVRPNIIAAMQTYTGKMTLQWRAGQLSGRTGNLKVDVAAVGRASMEGRAIVRPNRSLDLGLLTCPFAGTCERPRTLSFDGVPILLSSCVLPCGTRLRAVPGTCALTIALASDDRRARGWQ